jgi:hypothetical protein
MEIAKNHVYEFRINSFTYTIRKKVMAQIFDVMSEKYVGEMYSYITFSSERI